MKTKIIYSICLLFCISCVQISDVNIPKSEPKITLNCILYSGQQVNVHISSSSYIYEDSIYNIPDALVILHTDNSILDTLKYNGKYYTKPGIIIQAGICYSLEVHKKGFTSVFASECVPSFVDIDSINLQDVDSSLMYDFQPTAICILNFTDPSQYSNFYIPTIRTISGIEYPDDYENTEIMYSFNDDVIDKLMNTGTYDKSDFLVDSSFTNSQIHLPLYYFTSFGWNDSIVLELETQLFNVSYEYYKYHLSLKEIYEINQDNKPIYSNVENGYGIMAGIAVSNSYKWKKTMIYL